MDLTKALMGAISGAISVPLIGVLCGYISQSFTSISTEAGSQFDSIVLPAFNLVSAIPTELFVLLGIFIGVLGAVAVKAR